MFITHGSEGDVEVWENKINTYIYVYNPWIVGLYTYNLFVRKKKFKYLYMGKAMF